MKSLALWIGFLACLPTVLFSAQSDPSPHTSDSLKYQLVLVDPIQEKEFMIPVGGRITCKDREGNRYHGVVRAYSRNAILLREERLEMKDLVSINYFPKTKKWRRRFGAFTKVIAGGLATLGTGYRISTYIDDPESYNTRQFLVLVLTPIALAIPVLLLGIWMSKGARFTFNLRRKYDWYMEVVNEQLSINN